MNKIKSINTENLKNIPIIEIAKELGIEIKKNKKSICPFHSESTPSLTFYDDNTWFCFGCSKGGDNIELIKNINNFSFREACNWLQDKFSRKINFINKIKTNTNAIKKSNNYKPNKKNSDKSDFRNDVEVYEWFINKCNLDKNGLEYLEKTRNFSKKTIDFFKIKEFIPENSDLLIRNAIKTWGENRILKCGLTLKNRDEIVWIWKNHVILFPFYDENNLICYIQARNLLDGEKKKYINLKGVDTKIFNLKIINTITKGDPIYICEGITDTMTAFEMELNAVGILGASGFKKNWVDYFHNFEVKVIPDNDSAGSNFAKNIKDAFKNIGKDIDILKIPKEYKDLWEYYKKQNE